MQVKLKTALKHIPLYWMVLWLAIFLFIVIVGLANPGSAVLTAVKLSGLALCLVYSIIMFPHSHLLHLAIIITIIADCLLARDNVSIVGLTIFYLAQSLHFYRMQDSSQRNRAVIVPLVGLFLIIFNFIFKIAPALFVVCGFYALMLVLNVLTSWRWHQSSPKQFAALCGFIGFALFACCDLCTVISYASLTAIIPAFLYAPANFLAWFFYYPSQVLISNSPRISKPAPQSPEDLSLL